MNRIFNPLVRFAMHHERPIAIIAGLWFALSCAITARFIDVPDWLDIPYVTDRNSWAFAGAWNALWWGFIHPALDKRREALRVKDAGEASELGSQ